MCERIMSVLVFAGAWLAVTRLLLLGARDMRDPSSGFLARVELGVPFGRLFGV
jgi:hypothetical protein